MKSGSTQISGVFWVRAVFHDAKFNLQWTGLQSTLTHLESQFCWWETLNFSHLTSFLWRLKWGNEHFWSCTTHERSTQRAVRLTATTSNWSLVFRGLSLAIKTYLQLVWILETLCSPMAIVSLSLRDIHIRVHCDPFSIRASTSQHFTVLGGWVNFTNQSLIILSESTSSLYSEIDSILYHLEVLALWKDYTQPILTNIILFHLKFTIINVSYYEC